MNSTEVLSAAKAARESLAKGLGALQSDPNVPAQLLELASPIAQAMGALHQIERSGGSELLPHAETALSQVRSALGQLQAQPPTHDAVNNAMEAVAASLGHVHALNRLAQAQPAPAAAPVAVAPVPAAAAPAPVDPAMAPTEPRKPAGGRTAIMAPEERDRAVAAAAPVAPVYAPPPQHAAPQHAPQYTAPQPAAPQATGPQAMHGGGYGAYAPPVNPPGAFPPPGGGLPTAQTVQAAPHPMAHADPFKVAPDPFRAPPGAVQTGPQPQSFGQPSHPQPSHAQPAPAPAAPGTSIPSPPASGLPAITADLGAHSPTNFYKGLSGNDIIDHGGLFVATYKIPKMSTPVRLKISLPGGYEFEANGIVKWVREHAEGADVPPGFGAQFTAISPEARQLVYRYVRNREPIFHDDL